MQPPKDRWIQLTTIICVVGSSNEERCHQWTYLSSLYMTKRPHTCAKKYLPSIGQTVRPTSRQPHPPPHYEAIPLRIVFIPPYPTYIPTSNHHHLKWPLLAASILLCMLILAASTRTKTSQPLRSLPLIWCYSCTSCLLTSSRRWSIFHCWQTWPLLTKKGRIWQLPLASMCIWLGTSGELYVSAQWWWKSPQWSRLRWSEKPRTTYFLFDNCFGCHSIHHCWYDLATNLDNLQ